VSINQEFKFPFYAKATICLIGFFALTAILYIAKGIIIPIVFAIILAILVQPVVNFFVRRKINRVIAIVITLVLAALVIAGIGILLFSQAGRFSESWPMLVEKFTVILNQSIIVVSDYLNIDPQNIHDRINVAKDALVNINSFIIGKTIVTWGSKLVGLFIIPIYIFLILFYQPLLLEFIRRLFSKSNQSRVTGIISQIKSVIQRYLFGLFIEFIMVSILNTTALLILGIEYAILLGVIGGLLNVIPYIGGVIAVALPMMIAVATKSSGWYALYILIAYYIIQLIDNNFIVPKIVASKVKINALFAIIVVFVGNAIWGISGMFLSIPLLAIIKIIFDNVESLKPWGFLLGDTMPNILKLKSSVLKLNKKQNS